ncbi:MAG: RNA polymerase sigma factor [Ruminococcus sp.]|uniref:RNA polymerase sigma factor n=1 Tax=Ruminococcus sp. TaxID=41978 RepID=UPI0025F7D0A2|nr:RNA polymerase sigma factor [Ruminococcus sp.]MCR4795565.1 RNA polymerase sigma factor [Ruminococcus sp.]
MDVFEDIFRKFQPDVYRFLCRLTAFDIPTAEELTQETFYQAFLSLSRFRGECSMKTWLFQIAKNTYYKYIRKETRQRDIIQDMPAASSLAETAEQHEMLRCVSLLIEQLEEPARSVVQYRLYSEISYAEIAQLLDIRANTAAVIYNRTMTKLRNTLKERYGYEI